jgi:hypothetical protein
LRCIRVVLVSGMTYDDWKCSAPEVDDEEPCGCVLAFNQGVRYVVQRCDSHEFLYQQEEARRQANHSLPSAETSDEDDIPF